MSQNLPPQSISHLLKEDRRFFMSPRLSSQAHIKNLSEHETLYRLSLSDSDAFWLEMNRNKHGQ